MRPLSDFIAPFGGIESMTTELCAGNRVSVVVVPDNGTV